MYKILVRVEGKNHLKDLSTDTILKWILKVKQGVNIN